MSYKFTSYREVFSGLSDICSGDAPNKIFAIAKIFQRPDPLDGLVSLLVEIEIVASDLKITTVFNGYEHFQDYYSNFNCIGADPEGGVYVGEDDGFIVCKDKICKSVNIRKLVSPAGLNCSIYVRGVNSLVLGTSVGSIVHFDEDSCVSHPVIPGEIGKSTFAAIHGIGSDFMVAVGDVGLIAVHSSASGWKRVPAPTNEDFISVFCAKHNEVYIGDRSGNVWRWDGGGHFQVIEVDFDDEKSAICGFAEYMGRIYGAFGNSGIFVLKDERFVVVREAMGVIVGKIKSTNLGLIGVGSGWGPYCNSFVRFDGKKWSSQRVSIPF